MDKIETHRRQNLLNIREAINDLSVGEPSKEGDVARQWYFRKYVRAVSDRIDGDLRSYAPALHIVFDDDADIPAFIATPAVNVRIGDEIQKISWFTRDDLAIPEIRRGLGRSLCKVFEGTLEVSAELRQAGYPGITPICELEDEELDRLVLPRTAEDFDEEPMPT